MNVKKIKIKTLNIHNYHNFTLRKPRIIALFKKYKPDVVALQEIRDDRAKNKTGMDQAKQLNEELNFKYFKFLRVNNRNKVKGLINLPLCYEGLAILSKFPFSSDEITLEKHKDDTYYRKILVAKIKKMAKKNNYTSSSNYKYISFPEDNCNYDYIFIPNRFSFSSFECISEEIS